MTQTYPIPASPAPADWRYRTPPEEVKERNMKNRETDIFSSELNCFKNYSTKIQKNRYLQNKFEKLTAKGTKFFAKTQRKSVTDFLCDLCYNFALFAVNYF
jgi:hypothetical protein